MERFAGKIDKLRDVDVAELILWLNESPPEDWRGDLGWRDWPQLFRPFAQSLVDEFYPGCRIGGMGLWIVEPGQVHPAHTDEQHEDWLVRIHVPLATNLHCFTVMSGDVYHMQVGYAYRFNTLMAHAVSNQSLERRVHFMFDVLRGSDGTVVGSGSEPYQEAQNAR